MRKAMLTFSLMAATCILKAQVLYGTTSSGGNNNGGTICKLVAATNTLTSAYNLEGPDGYFPSSSLIQASDGKLYGMTSYGGHSQYGVIFSYDPADSTYTILKDFDGTNGAYPYGSLVQAFDGKLYGMTYSGGSNDLGVIFSYDPATSVYAKLKDFNYSDGYYPIGSLIQAADGKLYGMTSSGGSNDLGVIFSYDPATSVYAKLKDFNYSNGYYPYGSLIQASDGKLYGMTSGGGSNDYGVIFSYDPATSAYIKLRDFDGTSGSYPYGSLIQASDGKLYGMTSEGGSYLDGVIFSYDPATSAYIKLKDFDSRGYSPQGSLMQASDGKLYGMTSRGGGGDGVIFSYDPSTSVYMTLIFFYDTNGSSPFGNLLQASDGKLYGMTALGGRLYDTGLGFFFSYGVIFSYDLATSVYTKLKEFYPTKGANPQGSLTRASDGKLYGTTYSDGSSDYGAIFSFDPFNSVYTKLKNFDGKNGASPTGSLIQASDGKLYGMTSEGGSYLDGVIFSYDPVTSAYTKLQEFDNTNGAPYGSLIQASDGKLYGMTVDGGKNFKGVIFSYDPVTSAYTNLKDFDGTNGNSSYGSLVQATDGKLYGMTSRGGSSDSGVIFSYDPVTSAYIKLKDFDGTNGSHPYGSLMQASDGKLYGMTNSGGSSNSGTIFSYDPSTSVYTKLVDFDGTNGAHPYGSLMQASDGKLYGMTRSGGSNDSGVAFSYDILTSTYTKLSDFTGDNGSNPTYTSFIEMPGDGVQISIADKSIIEGNQNMKFIAVPITLSGKSEKSVRFNYMTRNNTATAGSDYVAQSGTLIFPRGIKKIVLPLRIIGDQIPEANETFSIILSNPVHAGLANDSATITILDDDIVSISQATQETYKTTQAINLSPNPARNRVDVALNGYSGNVMMQLSSADGRILQQQKIEAFPAKSLQTQQIDISGYDNGIYLVTVIDEKGNRQTRKLVIAR